ncbi:MAG: Molybdenum cofactor guanylyltransferase [Deltaproteobacteria bacterium ADurb.Bin510]|nr:MAG: Molybdenum cofactor guanylyltransferase [Deltaproteobacteria bacterium ADurb.Bin510]
MHPLCAVYRRRCAAVFKEQLEQGDLRLTNALKRLRTKYVEITDGDFAEMLDKNINTRADYAALGI